MEEEEEAEGRNGRMKGKKRKEEEEEKRMIIIINERSVTRTVDHDKHSLAIVSGFLPQRSDHLIAGYIADPRPSLPPSNHHLDVTQGEE